MKAWGQPHGFSWLGPSESSLRVTFLEVSCQHPTFTPRCLLKGKAEDQERRQAEEEEKRWTREEGFKASGRNGRGADGARERKGWQPGEGGWEKRRPPTWRSHVENHGASNCEKEQRTPQKAGEVRGPLEGQRETTLAWDRAASRTSQLSEGSQLSLKM